MLVSFSGMDGCGKTTQIENLRRVISELGLSDQLLTFWDNVVVLSRYREEFVHTVYGSERGVGSPEQARQAPRQERACLVSHAHAPPAVLD